MSNEGEFPIGRDRDREQAYGQGQRYDPLSKEDHGNQGPYRTPEPQAKPQTKGPWATVLGLLGLALAKGKSVLLLLKALPFAKFLLTSGSMLVYLWVYAARYGVWFALGFLILLLLHELGHGYVIKKYGLSSGWPIFIPFFGAMIALKEPPPSADADAEISFGGPLWGTIASYGAVVLYFITKSPLFLALAGTGFFLNMFNLTPMRPLDGGAIAEVFSRKARILGVVVVLALFATSPASPALMMLLFAIPAAFSKRERYSAEEITTELRTKWALRYFTLLAFLGAGMYFSRRLLESLSLA
jgi:Zn-dependent protease